VTEVVKVRAYVFQGGAIEQGNTGLAAPQHLHGIGELVWQPRIVLVAEGVVIASWIGLPE